MRRSRILLASTDNEIRLVMKAKVTFEVEIPKDVSHEDAEAWLRFELHETGILENRNPLLAYRVEPVDGIEIEIEEA